MFDTHILYTQLCTCRYVDLSTAASSEGHFQLHFLDDYRELVTFKQPPPKAVTVSPVGSPVVSDVTPAKASSSAPKPTVAATAVVTAAVPSDSLFVADIPPDITSEDLVAHFSAYASAGADISRFHAVRRTAVVTFKGDEAVAIASARQAKAQGRTIKGLPIRISWNKPPPSAAAITAASTPQASPSPSIASPALAVAECVVCFNPLAVKIAFGCGHAVVCNGCAPTLTECPVCRALITARIRLFE
jgi:hypothetical protein